jgi:hypothetical protein
MLPVFTKKTKRVFARIDEPLYNAIVAQLTADDEGDLARPVRRILRSGLAQLTDGDKVDTGKNAQTQGVM